MKKSDISRWLPKVEDCLLPATREELAVILDGVMAWGRAYDVVGDREALARVLCKEFESVPGWALSEAIDSALSEAGYYKFPLPKDIRKHLPDEYRRLSVLAYRMRCALRFGEEAYEGERLSGEEMKDLVRRSRFSVVSGTEKEAS